MLQIFSGLVFIVLSLISSYAHAEGDTDAARAHFAVGQSYYDQADYNEALREFREAYRLTKRPALLYNIALCHERLEEYDDAIATLEQYLNEDPKAKDRKLTESRIANLKKRKEKRLEIEAQKKGSSLPPPPVVTAKEKAPDLKPLAPAANTKSTAPAKMDSTIPADLASAPVPEAPPKRKRIATWVVGGVGLALLAASIGTGVSAKKISDDLKAQCINNICPAGLKGDQQRGQQLALATDIMIPIGAAAVVTGVILFFVEGRPPKAKKAATSFMPYANGTGAGATYSLDF